MYVIRNKDIGIEISTILERLYNYGLLNGSFNDNVGLHNGKGGWTLFLFHYSRLNQSIHQGNTAFSLLEEIIEQISEQTTLGFANGITGFGSLIDYLNINNFLDQNSSSILEDIEPEILKEIYEGKFNSLELSDGAAGYGMYLYYRLKAGQFSEPLLKARITEALIMIVDILHRNVNHVICKEYFSIIQFLKKVEQLQINTSVVSETIKDYAQRWQSSNGSTQSSSYLFFLLEDDKNRKNNTKKISQIIRKLIQGSLPDDIVRSVYYICLLIYYTHKSNSKELDNDIEAIIIEMNSLIKRQSLDVLFPFNISSKSINTGLNSGLSCLGMSYLSILTNNYSWLNLSHRYE